MNGKFIAAYADPPYVGQAKKHYGTEEIDHLDLFHQLGEYDAWALSASTPSLAHLLEICPLSEVRIGAWVKPFCIFKPGVNPAYAWEPVLWHSSRKRTREQPTTRDWVSCNITLKKGLVGAKPEKFCHWLFDTLNLQKGDKFIDLFPGSGAVTRAWKEWTR